MPDLTLVVKAEFFEAIRKGQKLEDYRVASEYWRKRIEKEGIERVKIRLGFPKEEHPWNTMTFKFNGFERKRIKTKTYGDSEVYAIDLRKRIT
jgi:hypothetical protein